MATAVLGTIFLVPRAADAGADAIGSRRWRDHSRVRCRRIILPPGLREEKEDSRPPTPPSFETKRRSSGDERFV